MTICKHCGCHEHDACYHPEFGNCWWVNENECSHCIEVPGATVRWSFLPVGTTPDQLATAYEKILMLRRSGQTNLYNETL